LTPPKISTVLFDLDDTLVDQSGAARAAVVPWALKLAEDEAAGAAFTAYLTRYEVPGYVSTSARPRRPA
jgi:FMN phosphatase YigB (HAD superfamily)